MLSTKLNKKFLVNSTYFIIVSLFLILVALLVTNFFIIYSLRTELNKNYRRDANNIKNSAQNNINNFGQANTPNSTEPRPEPKLGYDENNNPLFFSSFFDSFAADFLIDKTQTSLYRDNLATAIYFEPDYTWEVATTAQTNNNKNKFTSLKANDFSAAALISDRRCLGESCLKQKGTKLFYNDKPLLFPKEVKESEIAAISIGTIASHWTVGLTLKEGSNYRGRVYFFDGLIFSPLVFSDNSETISSPYFGLFGFGGEESDYLIIYGAYKGIAYRFLNSEPTDISSFFDIRVMLGGFRPEIIKVKNDQYSNWYIYSGSLGRTQLIKLWSDNSDKISGEVVFKDIFSISDEAAHFSILSNNSNEISLLAQIKRSGLDYWQVFSDHGFKNQTPGILVFSPVTYDSGLIIKQIANVSLGSQFLPCLDQKLSFSFDGKDWQTALVGQDLSQKFTLQAVNKLFLRVDFPAQTNKFFSPFLAEVSFDFYYQK